MVKEFDEKKQTTKKPFFSSICRRARQDSSFMPALLSEGALRAKPLFMALHPYEKIAPATTGTQGSDKPIAGCQEFTFEAQNYSQNLTT